MKKTFLIIACTAFSIAVASAQTDTTTNKSRQGQTQTSTQSSDWVKVKSSEIPSSLRTTFQGSEYRGWENGTVYRNKSTNEYYLELQSNAGSSPTLYYFDRNGKRTQNSGRGY